MFGNGFAVAGALLAATGAAQAHPGHGMSEAGFAVGFTHPFLGFDHLLAGVALGILASRFEPKRCLATAAAFFGGTVAGFWMVANGLALPSTGLVTGAAIIVIGVVLASEAAMSFVAKALFAGVFGIFFGGQHALEMPFTASVSAFGAGLGLGTAVLLAVGVGAGTLLAKIPVRSFPLRLAGSALVVAATPILFFA